jgi:hypothetical protein
MRSRFPSGMLLVRASQPGSAFQAIAIIGAVIVGVRWLLGRTSAAGAFQSALAMGLVWTIGSWLRRHFT